MHIAEELVSLDEIRRRLPELRHREKGIKTQLQSAITQAENMIASLKLVETLSAFQSRLHTNAATLDRILDRQKIVRLLVREVAVSDDTITIRHSIPVHQAAVAKSAPLSNPSENGTTNKNYLLRSYRLGNPNLFNRLIDYFNQRIGKKAVV